MPFPPQNPYQSIIKVDINVPGKYEITKDEKYKNKILCGVYKNKGISVLRGSLTFYVIRQERLGKLMNIPDPEQNFYSDDLKVYLQPSRLVTISSRIKKLAAKITKGKNNPLDKAKAIYDYII